MGIIRFSLCIAFLFNVSTAVWATNERVQIIGEHLYGTVLETPHPYAGSTDGSPRLVWTDSYSFPGAKYLVFEFTQFELAPGDWVEVRDPEGTQVHRYEGLGLNEKGGNFISKMVFGSSAEIQLWSTNPAADAYGYTVKRITRGFSDAEMAELYGRDLEAICGTDDKKDAVCYETAYPEVYDKSRAVARIVMDGSSLCTAWLVSCENHLMTNNHCTWDDDDFDTQGELDRMEFQFMYQDKTCGGGSPSVEYSFQGGTWLENDRNLDYTLIQAPVAEDPASTYGWLNIDNRLVDIGELIYIVGHPSGRPKEISLESTDAIDDTGFCEVYSQSEPVCVGGSVGEIGYMCDTEGGNSGSPVLSRDTHKVVALHHCANCPNRGVRIQNIWALNQAGTNPLPPCSLFNDIGTVQLDRASYGCNDTISIQVDDGSLVDDGSTTVTISSDSEASPETVTLIETPAGSGSFVGTIGTTTAGATLGDGLLSVTEGDTITVNYIDADDGQGGVDVLRQASANVDCSNPSIDSVSVTNITGMGAVVTWNTSEAASSTVNYGTGLPFSLTASDPELVTSHEVQLTDLSSCTEYLFEVASTDVAGNMIADDNGGAGYSFETVGGEFYSFDSTDTPIAIPDGVVTGISSTITVSSVYPVQKVMVLLNATHTWVADLDISLEGPDGTTIDLTSDNGSYGDNFVNTLFDDDASASITTGSAPFTGSFRPEEALSVFSGGAANGAWVLHVVDDTNIDSGTLDNWQLQLIIAEPCIDPDVVFLDDFESNGITNWSTTTP